MKKDIESKLFKKKLLQFTIEYNGITRKSETV